MKPKRPIAIAITLLLIIFLIIAVAAYFTGGKEEQFTEKNSVPVYFVRTFDNEFKLMPVRRKIYEEEDKLKVALGELLRGPDKNEKERGYNTEIPKNTELIELKETPERITINLTRNFETGGGSASMTLRVEQLTNTVLDTVENKPVYLELDGERVKHVGGEGVIIPQPLTRNLNRGQDI